ncbi:MAG TPA: hypothetical protein VK826_02505, partial [Bacteroidia bacterium]|nr:hypothetical protein [Bacteroidia bacterium]
MTLPTWLAYTIFIVLSLAVSVSLSVFAARKMKHVDAERVGFGLKVLAFSCVFSGIILGWFCWSKFTTTVIEISPIDEGACTVVGSGDYVSSDGQIVPVDYSEQDVYVINIGNDTLIRECIGYGLVFNTGENKELIAPHSFMICKHPPDYYPWEQTPDQISVPKGGIR